jgi:hypothetical protein
LAQGLMMGPLLGDDGDPFDPAEWQLHSRRTLLRATQPWRRRANGRSHSPTAEATNLMSPVDFGSSAETGDDPANDWAAAHSLA